MGDIRITGTTELAIMGLFGIRIGASNGVYLGRNKISGKAASQGVDSV